MERLRFKLSGFGPKETIRDLEAMDSVVGETTGADEVLEREDVEEEARVDVTGVFERGGTRKASGCPHVSKAA